MTVRNRRLALAGIVAAAAVAVPVAALAADTGAPTKPPGPVTSGSAVPSDLSGLAASAGISVSRLQAGLVAAKRSGGNGPAGVAAFAASTGVPKATAQRIVNAVFGAFVDHSLTGPAASAALAARLGVSQSTAAHALQQIGALSGKNGVDPGGTAFAAIARGLGVSPARLAAALDAVKQAVAGK